MLIEKYFTTVPYRYNHILIHWDAVSDDYDYVIVCNDDISLNELLTHASYLIEFSDCGDYEVKEVLWHGREYKYMGWQHGMLYEWYDVETKEIVFSRTFPEWDH